MQRPPLQVETVTDFWDEFWMVVGALGDGLGGLFAGVAVLLTAITLKRQVDDAARQQASQVVVRWFDAVQAEGMHVVLVEVDNSSDRSVIVRGYRPRDPDYELTPNGGVELPYTIHAHSKEVVAHADVALIPKHKIGMSVDFMDFSGKLWSRSTSGALVRNKRSLWNLLSKNESAV